MFFEGLGLGSRVAGPGSRFRISGFRVWWFRV